MIVLDTSVFVGALIPFDVKRHYKSIALIDLISERGLDIFEPKLLVIELSATSLGVTLSSTLMTY